MLFHLIKLRPYLRGADFTIHTDHVKKCFTNEIKNTRIQHWSVLLAEFAAPIVYMKGRDHIRADMFSRLKPNTAYIMQALDDLLREHDIPCHHYQLPVDLLLKEQKEVKEYNLGRKQESKYLLFSDLLYSYVAPARKEIYPRLVLPIKYGQNVMEITH